MVLCVSVSHDSFFFTVVFLEVWDFIDDRKMADGLFLSTARDVAKDYPDIAFDAELLDNTCLKVLPLPHPYINNRSSRIQRPITIASWSCPIYTETSSPIYLLGRSLSVPTICPPLNPPPSVGTSSRPYGTKADSFFFSSALYVPILGTVLGEKLMSQTYWRTRIDPIRQHRRRSLHLRSSPWIRTRHRRPRQSQPHRPSPQVPPLLPFLSLPHSSHTSFVLRLASPPPSTVVNTPLVPS